MGKHSKKKSHPVISGILSTIGTLLIVLALAMSALLVVPGIVGANLFCIATGSMEPEIPVGSLVYVESVDPMTLEVGDVISYRDGMDASVPVTHRIVQNDTEQWELTTRGDANAQPDPMPVSYGQVIGKVALSVPVVGYLALAISTPAGKISIALLIVAGIVLCVVADRIRRKKPKQQ